MSQIVGVSSYPVTRSLEPYGGYSRSSRMYRTLATVTPRKSIVPDWAVTSRSYTITPSRFDTRQPTIVPNMFDTRQPFVSNSYTIGSYPRTGNLDPVGSYPMTRNLDPFSDAGGAVVGGVFSILNSLIGGGKSSQPAGPIIINENPPQPAPPVPFNWTPVIISGGVILVALTLIMTSTKKR